MPVPQLGTHMIVADLVAGRLAGGAPQNGVHQHHQREPDVLASAQYPNHLRFGSVLPDFTFFFFDPAGSHDSMKAVTENVIEIHGMISDVVGYIVEIQGHVTEPVADLTAWFTGGFSDALQQVLSQSYESLIGILKSQMLLGSTLTMPNPYRDLDREHGYPRGPTLQFQPANDMALSVLRSLGHPYSIDPGHKQPVYGQGRDDYSGWWWFDLLHYRRTGPLAEHLLHAADTPKRRAVAQGYVSHIAADVVGHPFVNAVVGGPYRNHRIRHSVIEHAIEAWGWAHYRNGDDIANAHLHEKIELDQRDQEDIYRFFSEALSSVFVDAQSPIRPINLGNSIPSSQDFTLAYELFYKYLKATTSTDLTPPVPPPGSPADLIDELKKNLGDTFDKIKSPLGPGGASNPFEALLSIFLGAVWAHVFLVKLLTLPVAALAALIAVSPRWFLYYVERALYDLASDIRFMLALSGLTKMSKHDLDRPLAKSFYRLPLWRSGTFGAINHPYSLQQRNTAWWVFDPEFLGGVIEGEIETEASPYPPLSLPNVFIDAFDYDQSFDAELLRFGGMRRANNGSVSGFGYPANGTGGPGETVTVANATRGGTQLGSAVDFTLTLLDGSYPLLSFDLDADAGYGFLGWEDPQPGQRAYGPHLNEPD